jgi:hypothetical protein
MDATSLCTCATAGSHTDIINSIALGVLAILLLRFQCAKVGNQVILLFLTAKSVQGWLYCHFHCHLFYIHAPNFGP